MSRPAGLPLCYHVANLLPGEYLMRGIGRAATLAGKGAGMGEAAAAWLGTDMGRPLGKSPAAMRMCRLVRERGQHWRRGGGGVGGCDPLEPVRAELAQLSLGCTAAAVAAQVQVWHGMHPGGDRLPPCAQRCLGTPVGPGAVRGPPHHGSLAVREDGAVGLQPGLESTLMSALPRHRSRDGAGEARRQDTNRGCVRDCFERVARSLSSCSCGGAPART
mmetsp:Transcript_46102/g.117762  ORF Transcript_46102/g.117762 Transcript_46102/m.117762 type:complete len:218 (+) Transcript_46102:415-1068(+)